MENLKQIIAKNISDLRKKHKLTQLELAEKLNYSDKAVSKWERGESVPDVAVLKRISELFGVTVDYLLAEEHDDKLLVSGDGKSKNRIQNFGFITGMSIVLVWLIAATIVVMSYIVFEEIGLFWLAFVYSVPVSFVLWLVLNSVWFNKRRNFVIISLLMWSVVGAVFVTFAGFKINTLPLFTLCVPGQAIIVMWSCIKRGR